MTSPPPSLNLASAERTAALVSVGGSAEPIRVSLQRLRPDLVWYFCSTESRPLSEEIHRQLDWNPFPEFIEIAEFEELGRCYAAVRTALPRLLRSWRLTPAQVTVDYTGGTKTMSAALVLAAAEQFQRFAYVGGSSRDKEGLGTVRPGAETVRLQPNPWRELGVREAEKIGLLWHQGAWDEAGEALAELSTRHPRPERCHTLAILARALAARDRFDFGTATDLLARAARKARTVFEADQPDSLVGFVDATHRLCADCREQAGRVASPASLLRELIDNALRAAARRRFDDAAARLYRAMEMQGHLWLSELTADAFLNGRLRRGQPLPPELAACPACQPDAGGEVRLSLEATFRTLAALRHTAGLAVVAEIETHGPRSRWRAATQQRNASILAHGVTPVGAAGFADLQSIAADLLGFDPSRETNPIPPFESAWLL